MGSVSSNEIRKRIEANKNALKALITSYNESAKELKDAYRDLCSKQAKFEKKKTSKTEKASVLAKERYDGVFSRTKSLFAKIQNLISSIEEDWKTVIAGIEAEKPKSASKESANLKKYLLEIENKRKAGDNFVVECGVELSLLMTAEPVLAEKPIEETAKAEETDVKAELCAVRTDVKEEPVTEEKAVEEESKKDSESPVEPAKPTYSSGVALAPLNIDISSKVEEAVGQAMDKFSRALDKKITEYFKEIEIGVAGGTAAVRPISTSAKESTELQAKIAEDEGYILEKLGSVVETVKSLNNALVGITVAFSALDAKVNEIAEMQNRVNDMQRATLREQQGVQVNQKIITKEQLAVTEEQAALMASQQGTLEDMKHLSGEQEAIAKTQQAITETQTSLEEAMREVMDRQKKLIAAQQTIVSESVKSLSAAEDLTQRQKQLAEGQKDVSLAHKQLAKDQKSAVERIAEITELQKTSLEDLKEIQKEQKTASQKIAKAKTPKSE